jgi:hypothetical protein
MRGLVAVANDVSQTGVELDDSGTDLQVWLAPLRPTLLPAGADLQVAFDLLSHEEVTLWLCDAEVDSALAASPAEYGSLLLETGRCGRETTGRAARDFQLIRAAPREIVQNQILELKPRNTLMRNLLCFFRIPVLSLQA